MLKTLLLDSHDGSLSSKRVITFFAFILCGIAFISNLFWGYKIDSVLFEGMMYIAMVGLGVTASEKFAPKSKTINTDTEK
jgi:hypothetical protein